jgi:exonuclease SbcD
LTDRSFYEGTATEDYIHAVLTDEEDVPEAVGRLRLIYPNLMQMLRKNNCGTFCTNQWKPNA